MSYYLYDNAHAWFVAKYIEQNPIKAKMVKQIEEYERYIYEEMKEEEFLEIYDTPKTITKNGEMRVLYKRLKSFFEEDRDINRNENMRRAWEYGYSKAEIARFVGLSVVMVGRILK